MLDAVKNRLGREAPENTDGIIRIITEERERVSRMYGDSENAGEWVNQTGWIFTYLAQVDRTTVLRLTSGVSPKYQSK